MASLTDSRLKKAKPILDRYRGQLMASKQLDTSGLEKELKDVWKLGYQDIKGIMIDLSKSDEYVLLAARYMEGGAPGVVSEFKGTLAKLYGIKYYDSPERKEKQREFWERAFEEHSALESQDDPSEGQ